MLHIDPRVQIQHAASKKCILLSSYLARAQNDPDEYGLYPLPPCPFCREPITTRTDLQPWREKYVLLVAIAALIST